MIRMRIDIIRKTFALLLACSLAIGVKAQRFELGNEPGTVRTTGFWKNWFLQAGLDMTLQNPYGYDFSKVFPNGKSFGLDVAVGKWFTPEFALRGRVNWEIISSGEAMRKSPIDSLTGRIICPGF